MNERIRQIADEAAKYSATMFLPTGENGDDLFVEKFAELIIRECIESSTDLIKFYIDTHTEQEQVIALAAIANYSAEIMKRFDLPDNFWRKENE